jgi:hypothetical protein
VSQAASHSTLSRSGPLDALNRATPVAVRAVEVNARWMDKSSLVRAIGMAVAALEDGAGTTAVLAAVDQGRAAVDELGSDFLVREALSRLLDEVDGCARTRHRGSAELTQMKWLAWLALLTDN